MDIFTLEVGMIVTGIVLIIVAYVHRLIKVLDGSIKRKEKQLNKWGISFVFVGLAAVLVFGEWFGRVPQDISLKGVALSGIFMAAGVVLIIMYFFECYKREN